MDIETDTPASTFDPYMPPETVHDELRLSTGEIRPHWRTFAKGFAREQQSELARRWEHANQIVHENGITYNVFDEKPENNHPWQIDLLPYLIAAEEWDRLSAGIAQRAKLLSLVLDDLYGPQQLLKSGDLPPEMVYAHPNYHHSFHKLPVGPERRLMFFGCEVARSPDGRWWAMADRAEGPAGAGYALENRIVISRTWPRLIHDCHIRRLAPFFMRWQQALAELSPRATENPRIVLLTAGSTQPFYFEDVYLARYLGYTLVEGGDLAVRDNCVFIKTLDGLVQIDVIVSRVNESDLDPLEIRSSNRNGAAGLLQAIREGNVVVVNAPGSGFVESPAIMAKLPQLCRTVLKTELILPSIATWWCGDESSQQYVLDNLAKLVIKPAFEPSGGTEIFGEHLSNSEQQELAGKIRQAPADYVAQETIARSASPVWKSEGMQVGHAALRTFAMRHANHYEVMPGALVRVALSADPMKLSISAGDGSKDAWIVSEKPVEKVSLLPTADDVPELRRNSPQLPSRVADNLFWLGRHLDRAEVSARLLRVVIDRLSGERDADEVPELPALIHLLAEGGQIDPEYAIEDMQGSLPEIEQRLPAAIFDLTEPRSLRSIVNEIARLASTVRDRLSNDTWRAVNRIDERFHPASPQDKVPLDEALSLLNQLVIDLAVCGGLINDGMVRGPAWRFLTMGRRTERAQLTSGLLLVLLQPPLPSSSVLDAVLDVMDLQMTYRARYLAAIRPAPVFDLLLVDESNPRSLLYQLSELQSLIHLLPADAQQIGLSDEQKIVSDVLHQLQMVDLSKDMPENWNTTDVDSVNKGLEFELNLVELLQNQQDAMKELTAAISRKYLVHSGTPRRIQDELTRP
ncbi:circularly permuted type 2 ATP-grasp protein [Adhaeretor mobilis]|uniref:Uncharacterized protein n=1 Tax=Adhaeretor mobilis TaxID=1930276 RepID=A0A517MZF8_9BACT|nr:circularly permuted type 2 ATP-grasp protein [Adhaeretor mobilis]QDT00272.1 hypothetical protein HG15A2_36080 [Adhaeretor mobilis]